MKKNKAIVFTLSFNFTFAVACVMLDIKKYSPNLADEIVIIHDGICAKDQELLKMILPSRFILYDFPIKDTSIFNQGTFNYFTKMVFAKFECLKLLNDYHNVLFLDYDIVIQKDLSELFTPCNSGIKMMLTDSVVRDQLHNSVDDYDMTSKGISACIFTFHDHLNDYMKMYDFCYASTFKYASSLYLPEQAIFDFMIQEFKLDVDPIEKKLFSPHPNDKELVNNAKIIHAYGLKKFWNGISNDQWNQNYKTWLGLGGSKYNDYSIVYKIKRRLKKYLKINRTRE